MKFGEKPVKKYVLKKLLGLLNCNLYFYLLFQTRPKFFDRIRNSRGK